MFLPSTNSYAQNAVTLFRGILNARSTATICRTTTVHLGRYWAAEAALRSHQYDHFYFTNTDCKVKLAIEQQILAESIKSPMTIYGPYVYVRAVGKAAKNEKLVNKKYLGAWKYINQSYGYNGVHHIVTKLVIERIYLDLKQQGRKVSLSDMQNNAPSMYHPFHGRPEYEHIFHNVDEQYQIYKEHGMRALMVHQLELINDINIRIGLRPMTDQYIDGMLKETKLWCEVYGLIYDDWHPVEGIK